MGEIANNHYRVVNLTRNYLSKMGFRYCKDLSSAEDGDVYRYRFVVLRYQEFATLEAEITLNISTNDAIVDVMDNNRARYAPFYLIEYGVFPVVDEIEEKIRQQIKKLGMEVVKNDNNSRRDLFTMPVSQGEEPGRPKKHKNSMPRKRQGVYMGPENNM